MKSKPNVILHPFFFAIFPTLFILTANLSEIPLSQSIRPLIVSLAVAFILFVLLGLISRDFEQGAISASLILILFFSYGHVHRLLESFFHKGLTHIWLGSFWLALLLAGMMFKWKIQNPRAFTSTLNLMSAALLILPTAQILVYLLQSGNEENSGQTSSLTNLTSESADAKESLPDIYYIILDAYGRSDVLQELYDYDNSQFISFLQDKGFVVASDSHSNYAHTTLSLASSLNMEYVNDLSNVVGNDFQGREPTVEMIRHSQLRTILEQHGYQTVTFQTGSGNTIIEDSDYYFSYRPNLVNDLEGLLITSSAFRMFGEKLTNLFSPFTCYGHQGSIRNIFTNLTFAANLPGPQFVFAHVMSPHPPFIFGPNGDLPVEGECSGLDGNEFPGSSEEYRNGYRGQVEYITLLTQDAVQKILAQSDIPPIIIIQGDHGPGLMMDVNSSANTCLRERFSILNAYYLPMDGDEQLYQTITPVNSFRVVLNHYFGADLSLLEDKQYFSTNAHYYEFEDVTNKTGTSCR